MSIEIVKKFVAVIILPCAMILSSFTVQAKICAWGYIKTIQYSYRSNEGVNTRSISINFDNTGFPASEVNSIGLEFTQEVTNGAALPLYVATVDNLALAQAHRLPVKVESWDNTDLCSIVTPNKLKFAICSNESCN